MPLRSPSNRRLWTHLARFAVFGVALAAFGGIVAADVLAAETDDVEALELTVDDDAAPTIFARTSRVPDAIAAAEPPPPEPMADEPEAKPKKKKRRKKMFKFGRMDAY
jgi:hypothetical protein